MVDTEQRLADLALAGPGGERVMDTQQHEPSIEARVAREQGGGEAVVLGQVEKPPQRQQPGPRAGESGDPVEKQAAAAVREGSGLDNEPAVPPAARQAGTSAPRPAPSHEDPGAEQPAP